MARHNASEIITGAVVLVVAAAFLGYAAAHSGRSPASGYTLHAVFDHIDGLGAGADVRIAGVKVGNVTSATVDPKTFQAEVNLTVRDNIRLPKDSSAIIASESLLGGKYISLSPGGDEAVLQPGATITITQSSINIEDLLGKFIFSASNLADASKAATQGGQGKGGGK